MSEDMTDSNRARCPRCDAYGYHEAWCSSLIGGQDPACYCEETYPQLQPGRISHGVGCRFRSTEQADFVATKQADIAIRLLATREKQATEMCTWLTQENERLRSLLTDKGEAPYARVEGSIVGPNLKFHEAALVEPERQNDIDDGKEIILDAIVDMLNGAYRTGRRARKEQP